MSNPSRNQPLPLRNTDEIVTHWPTVAAGGAVLLLMLVSLLGLFAWLSFRPGLAENEEGALLDSNSAQSDSAKVDLATRPPLALKTRSEPGEINSSSPASELPSSKKPGDQETKIPSASPVVARASTTVAAIVPEKAQASRTPALPTAMKAALSAERSNQRDSKTELQLLDDLQTHARELDLEAVKGTSKELLSAAKRNEAARRQVTSFQPGDGSHQEVNPLPELLEKRPDLQGLPWRKGADCQAGADAVKALNECSGVLRPLLGNGPVFEQDLSFSQEFEREQRILDLLNPEKRHLTEESVAPLVQMLQPDAQIIRSQLIKVLASIEGRAASAALARRALFDLSDDVRRAAIEALKERPGEECRPIFLDGLRYPWSPVADHAAETLVALNDQEAVAGLTRLLDQPDPQIPFQNPEKKWVVAELVRVNHLRNCLLCHSASFERKDPVRGLVPTPGVPLQAEYCRSTRGSFVRADVTFLKQDFSVFQSVLNPGAWPEEQRFDYLIRTRELTAEELARRSAVGSAPSSDARTTTALEKKMLSYPQREAVLFALRKLTGQDAGASTEAWNKLLRKTAGVQARNVTSK